MNTSRTYTLLCCFLFFWHITQAQQTEGRLARSVNIGVSYSADLFANISGGRAQGIRYLDDLDFDATVDLEKLINWQGASLYIYGLGNQGGSISALAGDFQGVDNIEAENSWRLYEAWVQKIFFKKQVSVLIGLYDLNSEFDVINTALTFINSSQGIGAEYGNSGVMGPSIFPYTSFGMRVKANPAQGVIFKAAVLDGIPSDPGNSRGTKIIFRKQDGLLLAAEATYNMASNHNESTRGTKTRLQYILGRSSEDLKKIRFTFGAWLYSHPRTGWKQLKGYDEGIYASSEFRLYRESKHPFEGLSGFVRAGLSNGRINRLDGYLGAGLVYKGLFEGRPADKTGLAVAHAVNSSAYRQTSLMRLGQPSLRAETDIELNHAIKLAAWVQVQGDLQYVVHPNMDPMLQNALVAGVRTLLFF